MKTDYYRTRKEAHGSFVQRPEADILPGLDAIGYEILKGVLQPDLVAAMLATPIPASALLSLEPNSADSVRSALCVHETEPFRTACAALWPIAEQLLGGPCYVHQSRINFKRAMSGTGWSWHSDFETWHAQDGMPRPMCVSAMVPLEPNTAENGPLRVIPFSHLIYWSAPRGEEHSAEENFSDQKDGVPTDEDIRLLKFDLCVGERSILADPGDVFFFDSNLMHGSSKNESANSRTNFFVVFNRADNELVEPFSASAPRPLQMGYRK